MSELSQARIPDAPAIQRLHSGIAMVTLSALALNLLLNSLGGREGAAINDCHAHPH